MPDPLQKAAIELEKKLDELAHGWMERPSADPFTAGLQAGKYQGVVFAKQLVDELLQAPDED